MKGYIWLEPKVEAEIKFAERTTGGLLRHAELVAFRECDRPGVAMNPINPYVDVDFPASLIAKKTRVSPHSTDRGSNKLLHCGTRGKS
jgi:hypothetical protein